MSVRGEYFTTVEEHLQTAEALVCPCWCAFVKPRVYPQKRCTGLPLDTHQKRIQLREIPPVYVQQWFWPRARLRAKNLDQIGANPAKL